MLRAFERLLDPFPPDEAPLPPKGLAAFLWACTRGTRRYVVALALLSAGVSIYEAWLFSFLGQVVDLLSAWQGGREASAQERRVLWGIVIVLLTSIGLVALRTMVQHQVLAINLPLRLRWEFHRLMLRQSLSFFADEFAGRVTTKVMQTALAVREVLFTFIEIVLAIGVYFITIIALAGGFDVRLMLPFIAWIVLFGLAMLYFVPRLGKVGQEQAHARSSMTGRVTAAATPWSANAASSSPAASASASRLPASCSRTPHPAAGRSHQRAGLRSGSGDPGKPGRNHGGQDRDRDRPSSFHHRRHGPPHRDGPGADHRAGDTRRIAGEERHLRTAVAAPERRHPE
ncbi:membrane hypothetical protein [Cupriavidus necator]|uniref:ABC transmembrane type-1 domain-containing protein n=1 Tax=Cupriavidus necator TaxID=106590 RepID=A0A1K0IFG9_CUPNE|nr:membrane hypothetical protein [Cupriavidus necator]